MEQVPVGVIVFVVSERILGDLHSGGPSEKTVGHNRPYTDLFLQLGAVHGRFGDNDVDRYIVRVVGHVVKHLAVVGECH